MTMIVDAHCHFFSPGFFRTLAREAGLAGDVDALPMRLGWTAPESDERLADRWIAELDRHNVSRVMLIASLPGEEGSVATAVARDPKRVTGAFMINPSAADTSQRMEHVFG